MKKISTSDLIGWELENHLEEILTGCDFGSNLGLYVTGDALELLEKLPESERAAAIRWVISSPDYGCICGFPYPQSDSYFFLPPTELEVDITNIKLEDPGDFYIQRIGDRKLAYYAVDYGALVALDMYKLGEHVHYYLTDQKI